jgi:hypothetical protein
MSVAMSLSVGRSRCDFLQLPNINPAFNIARVGRGCRNKDWISPQRAFIVAATGIEGRGP